jgi:hypothetical protein
MKKLLFLFSASFLVLASCSNESVSLPTDSQTGDLATTMFPRKVIITIPLFDVATAVMTYDNDKIINSIGDEGKTNYTYTGNVITKTVDLDKSNVVEYTNEYTYKNGKVASFVKTEPGSPLIYTTVYTYNPDGSVSYKETSKDAVTNVEEIESTGVLTFKAGNIVKAVETSNGFVNTTTYEYDNKNSPYKNILGLNLLLDTEDFVSVNNIVKATENSSSSGGTFSEDVWTNSYKYNAKGFPTEVKGFDSDGKSIGTIQYFY